MMTRSLIKEKVICLDGWRFDFPKRIIARAVFMLDEGKKPTEVAKALRLTEKDIAIITLDLLDKRNAL
jgi:hypothetical protein